MNTQEAEVIPAPLDPIEQLIGVEEVARRLSVSEDTVWTMARDGRFIPPFHVGRLARWRVRDLNRWVEQRATLIKTIDASAKRSTKKRRV